MGKKHQKGDRTEILQTVILKSTHQTQVYKGLGKEYIRWM